MRCGLWATKSDDVIARNANFHFFGGGGAAARMGRVPEMSTFRVFHEHVFLCVKSINAHTTVRSAAPQKTLKNSVLSRKPITRPHES